MANTWPPRESSRISSELVQSLYSEQALIERQSADFMENQIPTQNQVDMSSTIKSGQLQNNSLNIPIKIDEFLWNRRRFLSRAKAPSYWEVLLRGNKELLFCSY